MLFEWTRCYSFDASGVPCLFAKAQALALALALALPPVPALALPSILHNCRDFSSKTAMSCCACCWMVCKLKKPKLLQHDSSMKALKR